MTSFLDNRLPPDSQDRWLQWREKILKTVYIAGMAAGAFVIVPLLIHIYHVKQWPLLAFDCLVVAWGGFALLFWRRLGFKIKAAGALAVFLFTGIVVLWRLGPLSGGGYWLFVFPIGSALLLGLRWGLVATAVDAAVFAVFAIFVQSGLVAWEIGPAGAENRLIITAMNFILLSFLSVVSISTLNNFLLNTLAKQEETKRNLERESRQLQSANEELRRERAMHDQAQGELWAEKEISRVFTEKVPLAVALLSANDEVEYINGTFTDIFGYVLEEVPTIQKWRELVYPDPAYRRRVAEVWDRIIASDEGHGGPIKILGVVCKDGTKKPVVFRVATLGSGKRIVLFEDCSERVKAEQALQDSDERYRLLIKNAPVGIIEMDIKKGVIVDLNDVAQEMINFAREEIIGKSPLELLPEEVHGLVSQKLTEAAKGLPVDGSMELYFTKRSDGKELCLDVSFSSTGGDGDNSIIPVVINDITERKHAGQALLESERRFRQTADLLPVIIIECNLDLSLAYLNRLGIDSFGYEENRLFREIKVTDLVHPDFHQELQSRLKLMRARQPVPSFEILYVREDGSEFYGLANCAPIINGDEVVGVRSAVLDITESKKSLEDLRDSEFRYRTLFENINDLYCIHDLDGKLLDVNPAAAKAFGVPYEKILGRAISEFIPETFKDAFFSEYMAKINAEGSSEGVFTVVGLDGRTHHLEYRNVRVESRGMDPYIVAVGRDVTERIVSRRELRRLQVQLQQSQKMEAVGTLAGGVAHDFNNILQAIRGYAEVLDFSVGMEPVGKIHLRSITDAVERASQLVQQLLTFSRKVEPELQAVDINDEVRQTVAMLARTIPKMIDIKLDLADDAELVRGDSNQLGQVLLNLGANARDAMPDGGILKIATENILVAEDFFEGNVLVPAGGYVALSVQDNGLGMNKQEMAHIYDPFFTTKPLGQGTGLGLSMVFGIVKGHKGYITCDSAKDKGTLFKVYLPVYTQSADAAGRQNRKRQNPNDYAGVETILLVDDEEPILNTLKSVIEAYGYKTLTANKGERALEIASEAGGVIDLVIMDLGMPGMGGLACMRKLHEMLPNLKVLIASGYSQHGPFEDLLDEGAAGYIRKPFAIADLMQKIRSVLEPRP